MVTDMHSTITKCTTCAQNRLAQRRHTPPLTLFQATEPLTELSVDIFGPTPASKKGNRFILVITDRFAKLTKCIALRRITAMSVASCWNVMLNAAVSTPAVKSKIQETRY